jgi:long-chain acyl-CoA synthetase
MADQSQFFWQATAQLFAGSHPVARQPERALPAFEVIPATPTEACLVQLGAQVIAGRSFCVSDADIPTDLNVPETHFLTLTGGSSGQPKAILRSKSSWVKSFETNATLFRLTASDNIAVLGKLSHSLALYGALEGLHIGCDVHVLDALAPSLQIKTCLARRIHILYATPTQLKRIALAAKGRILPDLRLILCGGGNLDGPTRDAVRTIAPNAALQVFYGAAETSFVTLSTAATPEGSVGGAYPGVTVKVLDAARQPTTGIGEVWVHSPYLFDRYMQASSPDTRWHDGFLTVGELGMLDSEGWLWLKGRKTRMITIADQNVYPEAVEEFISGQHGVTACAVLARPDALRGHHLIALVEGAQDADLAHTIQRACRRAFGPLIAPKSVRFVSKLPRRASGKIDLAALALHLEGSQ